MLCTVCVLLFVAAGHGPLSGQPVLSEAAQQEHITQQEVKAAASAAVSAEPQLKPPKPRKGFSGWVRRHLSLNVMAPWRAGKGCFGGGGNKGGEQAKGQQQPAYGTSGA